MLCAPTLNVHNLSWMETCLLSRRLKAFGFHVVVFFYGLHIFFFVHCVGLGPPFIGIQ